MSNYKTVFFTLGILQIILGVSMFVPIIVQFIYAEIDSSFFGASIVTIVFGALFFLTNIDHDRKVNLQQAFLLTALSWLSVAIFGSLPFIFSAMEMSITDAFLRACQELPLQAQLSYLIWKMPLKVFFYGEPFYNG